MACLMLLLLMTEHRSADSDAAKSSRQHTALAVVSLRFVFTHACTLTVEYADYV
jgi:hypothetical protein